jgi:hypothetical protein
MKSLRIVFVLVLLLSLTTLSTPVASQTTPKITGISDSTTPNGFAGYLTQGETGFTLYSSNASFGTTQGSVVIGTKSRYTDNSTAILQTITAWFPTAVTITVSTGSLSHGSEAFIFVLSSTGVASLGFPIYIQSHTPVITSLSPSAFNHGDIVTIHGSNFGNREDNHPDPDKLVFMWSDFNDDGNLYTNPHRQWGGFDNNDVDWSSADPRTTISGDGFYRRVDGSDSTTGSLEATMGSKNEYYYASWMRMNVSYTDTQSGQIKFFRQFSSGLQQPNWYPGHRADNQGTNGWVFAFEFHNPEVRNSCVDYEYTLPVNGNNWVFVEMYIKRATGEDSRDGEMWLKINNQLAFDWYKNFNINQAIPCFTTDNSGEFDDDGAYDGILQAGASYAQSWDLSSYVDSDDIYYDASQARVMVGNSATFSSSTAFEPQLPVKWIDTELQVRLNRGAYASLDGKWLYVVDKFGVVNELGFQAGSRRIFLPVVNR